MAKINKTYKPGDEFTPDSVNEIIRAVNKNTDDIDYVNTIELNKKVSKTHVLNNVDLNSVLESGFYRIEENITNMPPQTSNSFNYCQMLVIYGGGDTICQIVFPYWSSDFFYIRNGNNLNGDTAEFKPWAIYKASSL